MRHTQLYIDEGMLKVLNGISRKEHKSISELVRTAVEKVYSKKKKLDYERVLDKVCGIWANRRDLSPTKKYIRTVRKDTRLKRFGIKGG